MDSLQSEVEALEGLVDDWERDWFDSSIAWEVGARDLQRRLTTATAGSAPSISTRSLGGGDLGHGGEDRACPCPYCSSQDPSRAAWALLARAEWAYGALAEIRGEAGWAKEAASNYRASLQAWGDQAVANLRCDSSPGASERRIWDSLARAPLSPSPSLPQIPLFLPKLLSFLPSTCQLFPWCSLSLDVPFPW